MRELEELLWLRRKKQWTGPESYSAALDKMKERSPGHDLIRSRRAGWQTAIRLGGRQPYEALLGTGWVAVGLAHDSGAAVWGPGDARGVGGRQTRSRAITMSTIGATKAQIRKTINTLRKVPEEAEHQTATAPDGSRASPEESTGCKRGFNINYHAQYS
ncbi:unnamed protein product [Heligmosomoides polygyrus]|uniref:Transposase n=1 Tax=Heligmosomoides polygyrus TaxID=6339 RepID=A0A3P7YHA8_HELPZ|nr:unnamed protein product [Heligmosomoides polygyrus]